ncbi:YadA-like family protein [Veillonella magna]|uniref:YadA-like family protein n=1 Tax=Veillonella magna TaxID=464322 RepID=UPI0023F46D97|nr:YadA-like family protein [Veillonella magna]
MNRVFKVVWSKTKGMFIVVSEIAGTWQKQTSKAVVSKKRLASLLCVALAAGGIATSAVASDVATADHATTADIATKTEKMDYVNVKGTSSGNTAEDPGAKGSNSVAIGQDARADGPNGIAIGNGAVTASRGSDKSNNGTNSITIGTAKTAGSEILTLGTIKYVNSLYGRVNADGTIDTTKDIATIGDPVPFQDKVILMGYDTTFDANNKDLLKKDTDTFLRTSAIIGHENTIKTNSIAGFGWSYGESDMYIFGGRNTIDGEDSLILGRENDVRRIKDAGSGYVNITGDKNIIRNAGNGINISGSKNRINYYKEVVWYGGDAPNNNSAEKDFGNVSDPSLHIYGSRNTLGLDLEGRRLTSGFIVGENNRLYSYNGYVFGTYNNVYANGATVFGRGNLVGIDGNTPAIGTDFLALGLGNTIKSSYGMGVGASNTIESEYGMAFGRYNKIGSEASYSTVVGYQNYASKGNNVVFGLMNNNDKSSGFSKEDPSGVNSTAIGILNKSKGERSTTLGINNTVKEDGKNASAFGSSNTASGEEALAVGRTNYATNKMAVAVGNWNNYTNISGKWVIYDSGKSSVALGVKNATPGDYANAIGGMNLAMGTSSTAVGYSNKANGQADVALGYGNIAGGADVPSETYITAVGINNQAFGKQNSVFGAYNQANVIRGVVAGFQNFGMGYGSIIVGNQNNYLFSDPFTISGITMTGNQQPASTGILSTTMGVANLMLADNGGTYGYGNQVTGSRSYAFGATNINTGLDSFIMGHDSTIADSQLNHYQPNAPQNIRDAMVVGNHNLANISDSVALGSYATTSRDAGMRGYDPTTKAAMTDDALFTGTMTKEAYNQAKSDLTALRTAWEGEVDKLHDLRLKIQSQQYSSQDEMNQWKADYTAQKAVEKAARDAYFGKKKEMGKTAGIWEGQLAALSIGNEEEGLTRQITGVAAGTNDTDAVNVAQLKRVADMVNDLDIPEEITLSNGKNTIAEKNDTTYQVHTKYYGVKSTDAENEVDTNLTGDGAVGEHAIAIGKNAKADGNASVAIGYGSTTARQNAVAIGNNNTIRKGDANGTTAVDAESGAVAIGYGNTTEHWNSISLGVSNTSGKEALALGISNKANAQTAIAVGAKNTVNIGSENSTVFGRSNTVGDYDSFYKTATKADESVTLGNNNKTYQNTGVNVGITNAIIGTGFGSLAIGAYNDVGKALTSAVRESSAIGYGNIIHKGDHATVMGMRNYSSTSIYGYRDLKNNDSINDEENGDNYSAMGSVIIGSQNNRLFKDNPGNGKQFGTIDVSASDHPKTTGDMSVTIGIANMGLSNYSGAMGYFNQVVGARSYSVGAHTINTGVDSIIFGQGSSIGSRTTDGLAPNALNELTVHIENAGIRDALVVGNKANADRSDGIALGSYAATTRDKGVRGYDPLARGEVSIDTIVEKMDDATYEKKKNAVESKKNAWLANADKVKEYELKRQLRTFNPRKDQRMYDFYKNRESVTYNSYIAAQKEWGKKTGTWEAQLAALSIGNEELGLTRQITGVAAGTNDTDAVNVAQLKRVAEMVDSIEIPTIPDIPNSIMYTATNPTNGNTDSGTVADGDHVSGNGTDTPDDNSANNTVKKKSVTFTEGFNFTGGTNTTATIEENGVVTFDVKPTLTNMTSIAGNNGTITFGSNGISLGHGGTTIIVNSDGLNVGNTYITGVAPGRPGVEHTSDAVNMGQLSALQKQVADIDGKITNTKPIKLEKGTNTTVASREENGQTVWKVNVDLENYVTNDQLDNYVTNEVLENYVTNETLETTYVNKEELAEYAKTDASNLEANDVTKWKEKLGITNIEDGTATSISYQADGDTAAKSVTLKEGFTFQGDGNIIASTGDKGEVKYTLAKELTNMDSVGGHDGKLSFNETEATLSHGTGNEAAAISVGKDIRFTNGATTVKVTENGLDAGGTRIANVADGVAMSDAATVGQLRQAQGSVVQQISQVEHHLTKEIADVGALSAAMAALKPLEYNPDEKTQIMAGIGGYKGSQGVALGVAHHDNEDVMYHGGLAYSGNGVMWNAGISIRLGEQGDRKGYFLRYAPEPIKAEMARLYDEIDHLRKANATQMAMNETTDKQMTDYGSTLQAMQQSVNSLTDENAALRKQNEELAKKVEWLMARVNG